MRAARRSGIVALLVSLLAVVAAGAAVLDRGPYLQSNTTSSVIVVWQLDTAATGTLEYGTTLGYGAALDSPQASKHAVTVTNLNPGTLYYYRIRAGNDVLAEGPEYTFTTSAHDGPVRFLVFGDSGQGNAAQMQLAAHLVDEDVDLILHTGDVVYSSGQQYNYKSRFFDPYADILRHTPIFPTTGNHDNDTDGGQPYIDNFHLPTGYQGGERVYSFDWGPTHFVSIESEFLDNGIVNWVDADLAASTKPWKFVYAHHTAYSCDGRPTVAMHSLLRPILEQHNVAVFFGAHDHNYQRSYPVFAGQAYDQGSDPDYVDPPGVIHIVTGGGSDLDSVSDTCWYTSVGTARIHYVRATLDGQELVLEAVDATGALFDRATITRSWIATNVGESMPAPPIVVRPNPTSGSTLFDLGTIETQLVREIGIYDVHGRRVRQLAVHGPRVLWDGLDQHGQEVANGVYLLRLDTARGVREMGVKIVRRR